ncbi:MAG TPA: hypothetical protein VGP70_14030 [Actinomadura sp.]|nr:hypothetical protein [Actinomadura sp.]
MTGTLRPGPMDPASPISCSRGRGLAAVVRPLDEVALARTLPDPFADPRLPWWCRRLWTR